MENEIFDGKTVKKIISDLKKIIDSKEVGKILLDDYIDNKTACMDFAMVYEAVDEIKYFIDKERIKGVKIDIKENEIAIL